MLDHFTDQLSGGRSSHIDTMIREITSATWMVVNVENRDIFTNISSKLITNTKFCVCIYYVDLVWFLVRKCLLEIFYDNNNFVFLKLVIKKVLLRLRKNIFFRIHVVQDREKFQSQSRLHREIREW
jgi:hypothetical protein